MTSAAGRIWALVSGFPGERAKKRQLLMLQVYVDGSGTGAKDYLVLAGYIATAEKWADFSTEWARLLTLEGPYRKISYFKMKDMKNDARCGWFYEVIENNVDAAVSCLIKTSDLVEAIDEFKWPSYIDVTKFKNPYFFAFKTIISVLAQKQTMLGMTEPIDFIFDNETEKAECLDAWGLLKSSSSAGVQALLGDTPIYRDDKTTLPLQAADLYAYWVREWERRSIADGVEKLRFPWATNRDIPRLEFRFEKKDFLHEFEKMLRPEVLRRLGLVHASEISTALTSNWKDYGWTGGGQFQRPLKDDEKK